MNGTVVVGVDGSKSSSAALAWAADFAATTGKRLQAVIAWHFPASVGWTADAGDIAGDARQALDQALKPVAESYPELDIEPVVEEGMAAPVLLDMARTADLLVVGSRGHGSFAGMLLGSVSMHAVHHARCPVVVVPGEERS